jgi:hypothetical protein
MPPYILFAFIDSDYKAKKNTAPEYPSKAGLPPL